MILSLYQAVAIENLLNMIDKLWSEYTDSVITETDYAKVDHLTLWELVEAANRLRHANIRADISRIQREV
jgi:hypothetical protein